MSSMTRPAVLVMLSATILAACSTTSEKSVLVEPPRIATGILESYRCPPMPRLDITTATEHDALTATLATRLVDCRARNARLIESLQSPQR